LGSPLRRGPLGRLRLRHRTLRLRRRNSVLRIRRCACRLGRTRSLTGDRTLRLLPSLGRTAHLRTLGRRCTARCLCTLRLVLDALGTRRPSRTSRRRTPLMLSRTGHSLLRHDGLGSASLLDRNDSAMRMRRYPDRTRRHRLVSGRTFRSPLMMVDLHRRRLRLDSRSLVGSVGLRIDCYRRTPCRLRVCRLVLHMHRALAAHRTDSFATLTSSYSGASDYLPIRVALRPSYIA
jgi:hypothetical protein